MGQAKALWVTVALLFGLCAAHVAAEDVPASSKDKYRPFQAVSAAASADDYGGEMTPDISDDDLGYFYSFCSMLPRLEAMGRIPKNKKTQAMCSKLQFVLNPMFGNGALKNYKWV